MAHRPAVSAREDKYSDHQIDTHHTLVCANISSTSKRAPVTEPAVQWTSGGVCRLLKYKCNMYENSTRFAVQDIEVFYIFKRFVCKIHRYSPGPVEIGKDLRRRPPVGSQ